MHFVYVELYSSKHGCRQQIPIKTMILLKKCNRGVGFENLNVYWKLLWSLSTWFPSKLNYATINEQAVLNLYFLNDKKL